MVDLFDVYGEVVEVKSKVERCRDAKDNFILALARHSKADYLLTGDKDLLELKTFEGTKIIQPTEYMKKFK